MNTFSGIKNLVKQNTSSEIKDLVNKLKHKEQLNFYKRFNVVEEQEIMDLIRYLFKDPVTF